jgi:hypothetical protein
MKRGKRIVLWILGVIILLVLIIVIWFKIPYSPTISEFKRLRDNQLSKMKPSSGVFTEEDISKLPSPVQKYFKYCGYIGKTKMSSIKAYYNDVDFVLSPDKPKLKIKYTQYNFVGEPERVALIDISMYGIPFQGIDAYQNGAGSMKDEIHLERCSSFSDLKFEIDDYMDYYNNDRYQWGLTKLSPNKYSGYLQTGEYPIIYIYF